MERILNKYIHHFCLTATESYIFDVRMNHFHLCILKKQMEL